MLNYNPRKYSPVGIFVNKCNNWFHILNLAITDFGHLRTVKMNVMQPASPHGQLVGFIYYLSAPAEQLSFI